MYKIKNGVLVTPTGESRPPRPPIRSDWRTKTALGRVGFLLLMAMGWCAIVVVVMGILWAMLAVFLCLR